MVEIVQPGGGSGSITVTDGVTTVTNVTTMDFSGASVLDGGGGVADVVITTSGFTKLNATGTVNGVNTQFVFSQQPSYIVSDGVWYQKLDNNGATQWSWNGGTSTATMTIPPTAVLFGVA